MKKTFRWILCLLIVATVLAILAVSAAAAPAKPGTHADGAACKSHPGELVTLSDIERTAAMRNAGPMRAPSFEPVTADLPLLIIVIGFDNIAYRSDFDWAQEIFRADKSLAEYYTDMSFGKFTFSPAAETSAYDGDGNLNTYDAVNDGVVHVSLPLDHADWRLEDTLLTEADKTANRTLNEALIAAIDAADAYVDFSAYDVNSDGAITTDELALGFVVAGYEACSSYSYSHGKTYYLWSNAYSFLEAKTFYNFTFDLPSPDGVTVNSYIAISEQEDDGSQEPISTLAHELGHYLGLPDLYDTLYSYSGDWLKFSVSNLSLMADGMYGTDPDTGAQIPYSLDAWSRAVLGWADVETVGLTGDYTLAAQNYEDDAGYSLLRINTRNTGEYYLLENRSFLKWDAGLADKYERDSGGIVLWHIDDAVIAQYFDANTVNSIKHRPGVMPLYPESNNGVYSFIGANSKVYLERPFFDMAMWNNTLSSLGTSLDLPLYGTDSNADKRIGRTLSGTRVMFLSDADMSMQVRINPGLHIHAPVYTVVTEPGCTEPGAACYFCEGCGCYFADETCAEQIETPFALEPLGHKTPVYKVVTTPTCTEPGAAYYLCERCGKHFSDEACTREIDSTFALNALGHTQPNSNGKCGRCGAQLVTPENPPAPSNQNDDLCPYCHTRHTGTFGPLIAFFHRILYFFAHLFGLK